MSLHPASLNALHRLPRPAHAWRFDLPSALIGALVTLLLVGLAYYFRDQLRQGRENIRSQALQLYQLLQAGIEERYCRAVAHLHRRLTTPPPPSPEPPFIAPHLLVPRPPPQSTAELDATLESIPEARQTIPLSDLLTEHDRLLIVAPADGGKTTLLTYLARTCARQQERPEPPPPLVQGRTPLYISLPAVTWSDDAPTALEPFVQAAIATAGDGDPAAILRRRLERGEAVILLDDWDALPQPERETVAARIEAATTAAPGNLWLIAVGEQGYGPLVEKNFVPLTLPPWDDRAARELARQWGKTYHPDDLEPPLDREELTALLRERARQGDPPLELALRAFVYLADRQTPTGRATLFDRALEILLSKIEPVWASEVGKATLEHLALRLLREDSPVTGRVELEAEIKSLLPPSEEEPDREAATVLRALTGEHGLLRHLGHDRYAFIHHEWQAYLAARRLLAEMNTATLQEHLEDPRWAAVLLFYAEMGDIGPLVSRWLRTPDDIFFTRMRTLGRWIKVAPGEAAWRNGALAVLARTFLAAKTLRSRQILAQTLAETQAPGIAYFFKQALKHNDAAVRIAAVVGFIRATKEPEIPVLEALLDDEEPAVAETVVRSLADVGSDAAIRLLERILLSGDETLAPLAAETLARCSPEAQAILNEAASSDDHLVRRAAIFGLVRIAARDTLEHLAREDDQWIVRTGAQAALEELDTSRPPPVVVPPPQVENLPWLISWAAARNEGVGIGDAAHRMLLRALQEGKPQIRRLAARVLAQVGRAEAAEPLRAALDDEDPLVAEAAWEALTAVARRYGLRVR